MVALLLQSGLRLLMVDLGVESSTFGFSVTSSLQSMNYGAVNECDID